MARCGRSRAARAWRQRVAGEHTELGEGRLQGDRLRHRRLRVVGQHDHGVLVEEGVEAAGGAEHARELNVGQRQ